MVWSATHVVGFNRGKFAQLRNTMQWQWWFGVLAHEVKCEQLLRGDKRDAYFLNQLEDCKVVRNWKIFESGEKNSKLTIQCLEHESSRLVLQANGRQYSYWGRRPESGVVVCGDESLHIQKNMFPVPLDYYKQELSARVRLLLARSRTQIKQHSFHTTVQSITTKSTLCRQFETERLLFLRICCLGEGMHHIFATVMRYFNPLQNLTFIWQNPCSAPLFRSGGLCTSIVRRTKKRKKNRHATNKKKRPRLKFPPRSKVRQSKAKLFYLKMNSNKMINKHLQQGQEHNKIMSMLSVIKTNIVWEILCRPDDRFMNSYL